MSDALEDRVRQLEIHGAITRHDAANMRMSVTGLDVKIDRLQASVMRVGMAIVSSIIMALVGVVAYFIVQKDEQLTRMQTTTHIEGRQ
jgi:hypothetical protein